LYQPENFKSDEDRVILSNHRPDLMIVVAYGLLLPIKILNIPRYGCINVHASLLPRWRGAAPIQRAIEAGDDVTGITMMQMDVGLDTGDILSTVKCNIESNETGGSSRSKIVQDRPCKTY
jgi:methionyl-tRNA formyltransferase